MANLKYSYDLEDVETGGGGEEAPVGVMLDGKVVALTHRSAKSDGSPANDLELVVDVGSDYRRLWRYINFEANQRWKMRELTDALGLPAKGTLTDAILKKQEGKKVKVKTGPDTNQDGTAKTVIKNLFAPGTSSEEPSSASNNGDGTATEADPEFYAEWTDEDIKTEIAEKGLKVAGRFSRQKGIDTLVEEFAGSGSADDSGGEFDITTVEGYETFSEWTDDDLRTELGERSLTVTGKFSSDKARALIVEAVQAESGGTADVGTVEDDYDNPNDTETGPLWTDDELKDEIKSRNEAGADIKIVGRPSREKLIEALRADNLAAVAAADTPF